MGVAEFLPERIEQAGRSQRGVNQPQDPREAGKARRGRTEAASPSAQTSILVIDDERHSREGLRDALLRGGYAVETASDTWEAIGKIRARPTEVVIIDLDLPPIHGVTVSGWDLVRICRAYRPDTIIIVVGAEGDAALRTRAERLRVAEFLEKPISPAYVQALVKRLAS